MSTVGTSWSAMPGVGPGAVAFAVVAPVMLVAHSVADHWVQTEAQAAGKARPGWSGRRACAAHVATYTLTVVAAVLAVTAVLGVELSLAGVVCGQLVSAVSHYVADRRAPLQRMAAWSGHARFWELGAPRGPEDAPHLGTGAYALDQAWHRGWLLLAALVTVTVGAL